MKLRWVPNATLSLLRCIERSHRLKQLPDAALSAAIGPIVESMSQRLISASVDPQTVWQLLIDELLSTDSVAAVTPQQCEIACIGAGVSQLQSDQVAAVLFRGIESCRVAMATRSPRLADQLKLRIAPLQQAYQAYGPGLIRSVGRRIWNGPPPEHWWPSQVTVHAALPIDAGASGFASETTSVWIEAVLTDVDPSVPEWLRLAYEITRIAVDSQTRMTTPTEYEPTRPHRTLPWSIALVPIVLAEAASVGAVAEEPLPIATALRMWRGGDEFQAAALNQWWRETGHCTSAMPMALKQLAKSLQGTPTGSGDRISGRMNDR